MAIINMHTKRTRYKLRLNITYLCIRSLSQRIPVYSDSDMNSIHIQEHSRHRSCKDHFYKGTENKVNIGFNKKHVINWKEPVISRHSLTMMD